MKVYKRPWGNYQVLGLDSRTQVKRVEISPGLRLSLQKHFKRSEKWIILSGRGKVSLDGKVIPVREGTFINIPKKSIHRIHNTGKKPLVFIEVQFGNYLGEDDIVRFQDDFGRT